MTPPSSSIGADGWPDRESSRFVEAAGLRWHVNVLGEGPTLLLLHGTGAATHSWRRLVPLLAPHFKLVAPDLPGHGLTQAPSQRLLTLPGMAEGVGALLRALDLRPELACGHSAGAAVAMRMVLDGTLAAARGLVSLNGALIPFSGSAARLFGPLAKLLFVNPIMPRLFAWKAGDTPSVERLIRQTGSTIDAEGVEYYRRLVASPKHVAAALGMMANWDLEALYRDLPRLTTPVLLVAGLNDRAIRAEEAFTVRDRLSTARVEVMRGLGHLAHEEEPAEVASLVLAFARSVDVLSKASSL